MARLTLPSFSSVLVVAACCTWSGVSAATAQPIVAAFPCRGCVPLNTVRLVYMVPSNRQAQPNAEKIIQRFALTLQRFYRESMARSGYAEQTFAFETTERGSTVPVVHVLNVSQPDEFFQDADRNGLFTKILSGLTAAGTFPFVPGVALLVIAEIHRQLPDGSLLSSGGFFGGLGAADSGVAVVTGETLARMPASFMVDDRPYQGLTIPTVGPFPLVFGETFPGFEGPTLSSTSSSAQGGAAHELGHAFGLPHEFINDTNFDGNLMGNGFRGLRGFLRPEKYPGEEVRIAGASALALSTSRFFNPPSGSPDNVPPVVEILSTGVLTPVRGLLEVRFRARDVASTLAGVVLLRAGDAVASMPLSLQQQEGVVATFSYVPGVSEVWQILAYDTHGNRTLSAPVTLTPAVGFNRAPEPFIRSDRSRITAGESVFFDVARSVDPDGHDGPLQVEWDLDGDGQWDTAPSGANARTVTFPNPGVFQVAARVTDAAGDSSVSMHIGIRVDPRVVNSLVTFVPIAPPTFTADAFGCPSGYAGRYSFTAQMRNQSQQRLSALRLEVTALTGGNLLLTEERLFEESELALMNALDGRNLAPGDTVAVPLTLCLDTKAPFQFFVNVRGIAQ